MLAHKGRLAAIDSRVKHTRQILNGLKGDLTALQEQAAIQERSGKTISDDLGQKISGASQRIADRTSFIEDRHQEKSELDDQFQADLARYRKLKGTSN